MSNCGFSCLQGAPTGRRLLQSPLTLYAQYHAVVKATGDNTSTSELVTLVKQDPCQLAKGSDTLCDRLAGAGIQSVDVVEQVIQSVDFSAVLVDYAPGRLQIQTSYLADGQPSTVVTPRVAVGGADSTDYLSCTSVVQAGGHLLTCDVSSGPEEALSVTVSADSLAAAKVLSVSIVVVVAGRLTIH